MRIHLLKKWITFITIFSGYFILAKYTENIPVSSGLGWDGTIYAKIALNPIESLIKGELAYERIQRILPSIISYLIIKLLNRELNIPNIIIAFQLLNAFSMTLSILYWTKICKVLKFNKVSFIASITLLIINFQFIKFYSYYHVLTDYFAYFISITFIYYWLKGNIISQLLILFISAFTWPALFFQSIIMFCFQYKESKNVQSLCLNFNPKYLNKSKTRIFNILLSIVILLFIIKDNKDFNFFYIACMINFIFIIYSFNSIILEFFTSHEKNIEIFFVKNNYFILFFALIGIIVFYRFLTPSVTTNVNPLFVIKLFLDRNFHFPFLNILSHSIVLSPIIFLVLISFSKSAKAFKKFGLGFLLPIIFSVIFITNTETRHLLHVFPIYIIIFCMIYEMSLVYVSFLLLLQLVCSSFYINFNIPSFNKEYFFSYLGAFVDKEYYISNILPFGLILLSTYLLGHVIIQNKLIKNI